MKLLIITFSFLTCLTIFGVYYVKSQINSNQKTVCEGCETSNQGCSISGRVIDINNNPIAEAKVSSMISDRPPRGRVLYSFTNEDGRFVLGNVECGDNIITAEKEEDGYPQPLSILSDELFPSVFVEAGKQMPEVEVKLGPKSPRLIGKVVDKETGKSANNVRVTICRADDDKRCYSTNIGSDGNFSLLAPLVSFTVRFSSPKHKDWIYGAKTASKNVTNSLTLPSGEVQELTVYLEHK
ncbi:MAG TPA: carboxypeptidase-like regulatory domain-containing protein [Pyrinomonadaceae bacterium]|nr:carboxypeptidase-like regulatory domain-containing protein [Pyrinomonadaceae bacterium]